MDLLFHQTPNDGGLFPLSDAQGRVDGLGETETGTGMVMVRYRRLTGDTGYGELMERGRTTLMVADSNYRPTSWVTVSARTFTEVSNGVVPQ